jgi:DNA polymerase III delta prime subunit
MHHANIIINKEDCRDYVSDILKRDLDFDIKANPDFLNIEQESFGIDDARDLIKWAIGKPFLSETKVSLIITKSVTQEAQNALLKVLEEPPLGTYIFFHLENLGGILGTFLSRIKVWDLTAHDLKEEVSAKKFLNASIQEKLATIRALSKKEDKNKIKELIKDLETVVCQNKISANRILSVKIFASARGSSPKMLLEWLTAVL